MNFVKPEAAQAAFTLIHISDFHLCCPAGAEFSRFFNKRAFSYSSWKLRRQHGHRMEILQTLIRAVQAEAFDHIAVTGDLTQLALPAEFEQARLQLQALGPPDKVFVVPGNHDALVAAPWPESYAHWTDYMASDSANPQQQVEFPTLRIRGPVALIGLTTAHPTRILSAAGSIGKRQLQRLTEILHETARNTLFRVLLIHHPPKPGMVSSHKRLEDTKAFGRIIKQHGAELILHGHSHRCSCVEMDGPIGRIPVLGIASASADSRHPQRRAAFRRIRIARTAEGWTTRVRDCVFSSETQRFIESPVYLQVLPTLGAK